MNSHMPFYSDACYTRHIFNVLTAANIKLAHAELFCLFTASVAAVSYHLSREACDHSLFPFHLTNTNSTNLTLFFFFYLFHERYMSLLNFEILKNRTRHILNTTLNKTLQVNIEHNRL